MTGTQTGDRRLPNLSINLKVNTVATIMRGVARIWRLRRNGVLSVWQKYYLFTSLLLQCAQTVALEMLQQYAGVLTVPDLQHYLR